MKKGLLLLAVLVCSTAAYTQTTRNARLRPAAIQNAAAVQQNTLPIRRVILYSNGVAYIERRGMITGNAEVNLSFKQSQVDDVLKSMVVLDMGQGRIGAISYKSSMPASARTAEIPFAIDPPFLLTKNGLLIRAAMVCGGTCSSGRCRLLSRPQLLL